MGNYNSTRWNSYTRKQTTTEALQLRIQDLVRRQLIPLPDNAKEGRRAWSWSFVSTGKQAGEVGLSVTRASHAPAGYQLKIFYGVTRGDKSQLHTIYAPIDTTPCHYGGVRYWFLCPECGRRSGVLYLTFSRLRFACRKCSDLVYSSSQESRKLAPYQALIAKLLKEEMKYLK